MFSYIDANLFVAAHLIYSKFQYLCRCQSKINSTSSTEMEEVRVRNLTKREWSFHRVGACMCRDERERERHVYRHQFSQHRILKMWSYLYMIIFKRMHAHQISVQSTIIQTKRQLLLFHHQRAKLSCPNVYLLQAWMVEGDRYFHTAEFSPRWNAYTRNIASFQFLSFDS